MIAEKLSARPIYLNLNKSSNSLFFCEGRWLLCWFTYSLVGRQMTAKTYTNRYIMSSMFCEKCKNNEIVTLRKKFRLLMWLQTKI